MESRNKRVLRRSGRIAPQHLQPMVYSFGIECN